MISVRGFSYTYPRAGAAAIDRCDLDIADGEFVVVAGESGSGKSTLARALCGLVPHVHGGTAAGTVDVFGRSTRDHPPRALADIAGFVAQDPEAQSVVDRVEDEIAFAMENLGVDPVLMRKRVEETLDAVGIASLRDRSLTTLSGGERQRVAIASVLAAQPRVLILDEPTSQLDPQSAEDVLGLLQRLNADLGLTIVLVEHRLERVLQYADRLVVLEAGRIVADGPPRDVLAARAMPMPLARVARELGWKPIPLTIREGRAFARSLQLSPSDVSPALPGEVVVHARDVRVARDGRDVLRGIDLDVGRGECVAVVGRNGAGKTTLLRALLGLVRASGERRVAGFDVARTATEVLAARAAYVPQHTGAMLFAETVRQEAAFTLRARGGGDPDDALRAHSLDPFADADPLTLSAGQRSRVAVLAATAGAPDVIVLDEPTRGVDASGKDALAAALEAWRARGAAVVLVTHDVELVARVATRVVLLAEGRVVLDGPVREVLGESALFSSQMNKVFGDRRVLTVEDALAAVGVTS